MRSIIVAYSREEDAKRIRSGLVHNGVDVTLIATTGAQVLSQIGHLDGGIIICGYKLKDMIYRELAENMPGSFRMLLVSSPGRVGDDVLPGNIVFLATPLKISELVQCVNQLLGDFRERRKTKPRREHSESEKNTIFEAKMMLMERNHMTEPEAHRYLQKCAMDSGNSLVETSEMILLLAAPHGA